MPNSSSFRTKEDYNRWYRDYRKRNRNKMRKYQREYNREWRKKNGYHNEEKWKKKNPGKVKAQKKLQVAVQIGQIVKRPCAICGKINVQGHHFDYRRPYDVLWLCPVHHKAIHKSMDCG